MRPNLPNSFHLTVSSARWKKVFPLLCALVLLGGSRADANERRFTYVYESPVLPPGARELELWNTYRSGRSYFFRRLDQRLELEFGVMNKVMSAFYLNYEWIFMDSNKDAPGGTMESQQAASISSEWKYKVLDRVADRLGMALYGEYTLGLDETELEAKIILDKQMGALLAAGNIAVDNEWKTDFDNGLVHNSAELSFAVHAGISFSVSHTLSFGIEAVQQNVYSNGTLDHAAFLAGPVISYSTEQWWATWTFLPQLAGTPGTSSNSLNLADFERVQSRFLFSFSL